MQELIYSRNAVYETLRAKRREVRRIQIAEGVEERGRLEEILKIAKERKIPLERVPRARLDRVHQNHQGVVLEVGPYPYSDLVEMLEFANHRNELPFLLMVDSLQDPQNFGTLLRSAEAIGIHGVVIPLAHAVDVTPAVVNASSGASEHLRISRSNLSQTIDTLKESNIWIVGLDQEGEAFGEKTKRHLQGALVIVVGSEGVGLRELTARKCDILLKLPMRGQVESLNAAVAGSIALYLAYLERKH